MTNQFKNAFILIAVLCASLVSFGGTPMSELMASTLANTRILADKGDLEAQYDLGRMYANGDGLAQDYTEAVRWYRKSAEQGNADAQLALWAVYSAGQGVTQDYIEATRWCRKSAEQGAAGGQFFLGVMYGCGQGVVQDDAEAYRWYRKAAEQGLVKAQLAVGMAYRNGQGVAQDHAESNKWFQMAADKGDSVGQFRLGVAYYLGQGVTPNQLEALKWVRKAAEQGYAEAQYVLAMTYNEGKDVTQDYTTAHMWASIAAINEEEGARELCEEIAGRMTVEQLAESQRKVIEWGSAPEVVETPSPAKAFDTFTINGNEIIVPVPDGFVRVTDEMTAVTKLLQAHHSADPFNDVIAFYIEESDVQLALAEKLPHLDRRLSLKVNKELREMTVSRDNFSRFKEAFKSNNKERLEAIRSELPNYMKAIGDGISQSFDVEATLEVFEMIPLEAHYETEDSIASSMYMNTVVTWDSVDDKITQSATSTLLNVSGTVLFLYAYAPKDDLELTRSASSDWAEAVLAANSQSASKPSKGSPAEFKADWDFDSSYLQEVIVGAIVAGLLLAMIGGFFLMFMTKKEVKKKTTPVSPPQLKKMKPQAEESAVISEPIPSLIDSKLDIQKESMDRTSEQSQSGIIAQFFKAHKGKVTILTALWVLVYAGCVYMRSQTSVQEICGDAPELIIGDSAKLKFSEDPKSMDGLSGIETGLLQGIDDTDDSYASVAIFRYLEHHYEIPFDYSNWNQQRLLPELGMSGEAVTDIKVIRKYAPILNPILKAEVKVWRIARSNWERSVSLWDSRFESIDWALTASLVLLIAVPVVLILSELLLRHNPFYGIMHIVVIGFLMWAFDGYHEHGYYIFLRFITAAFFIVAGFLFIQNAGGKMKPEYVNALKYSMFGIAVLYNPFVPLELGREIWEVVNGITILLILSMVWRYDLFTHSIRSKQRLTGRA